MSLNQRFSSESLADNDGFEVATITRHLNVGTGQRSTLLKVLRAMGDALDRKIEPVFEPTRAGDVRHSVADIDLAARTIGYRPAIDLASGLEQLVRWARQTS